MATNKGRVVIFVSGMKDSSHTKDILDVLEDYDCVDVTQWLKHDLQTKPKKGEDPGPTVDNVIGHIDAFGQAVQTVIDAAIFSSKVHVFCNWGTHRSPVTAAVAAEVLRHQNFSVVVCELKLVRPEYRRLCAMMIEAIDISIALLLSLKCGCFMLLYCCAN